MCAPSSFIKEKGCLFDLKEKEFDGAENEDLLCIGLHG